MFDGGLASLWAKIKAGMAVAKAEHLLFLSIRVSVALTSNTSRPFRNCLSLLDY